MRKIFSYVLSLVAIAGTLVMNSCSKDNPTPSALGVEFVNAPTTFTAPKYEVTVRFTAPNKIDKLELSVIETKKDGNTVTTPITGFPKTSGFSSDTEHSVLITYTPDVTTVASFVITGTVTDKKGANANNSITKITIGGAAGDISTYTAVLLGDQTSTTPSFFASSTGTTYTQADAKANSASIDFAFGTGAAAGNEFFIGSPIDISVAAIYNNPTTGVQTWATKNATTFKISALTATDFDAVTKDDIAAKFDAGTAAPDGSRVKAAATTVGSVFGFQTAAGKKGLAKVTARTATSITLVVKVQK